MLSHHGVYEYGSPKLPMIPEAFVLHYVDNLDAKMFMTTNAVDNDPDPDHTWRERGYSVVDLPLMMAFGTASGYLSVFVFTMYLNSEKVTQLYTRPDLLWLFCPLLLYWIMRIWLLAWRGRMHDDPLAFAAKDPQTYIVGMLGASIILFAI